MFEVPVLGESRYHTSARVLFSASLTTTRVNDWPLRVTVDISRSASVRDRVIVVRTIFWDVEDTTTFETTLPLVEL
jgi:hypothetical protein